MGRRKEMQCLMFAGLSLMLLDAVGYFAYTSSSHLWTWLDGAACVILFLWLVLLLDIWRQGPADSLSWRLMLKQYAIFTMFKLKGRKSFKKLIKSTEGIAMQQEALLKHILEENKDTEQGRTYMFSLIGAHCSREQYMSVLPLTTYEDYVEKIERLSKGERNILTRDELIYFGASAGTTGKKKFIPVTTFMNAKTDVAVVPLLCYVMHKKVGLGLGRTVNLSYKAKVTEMPNGLRCGPISSYMSRYIPWYTSPQEAYQVDDEQVALYVHAVFALAEPEVVQMESISASVMYSFWCLVEATWQDLCRDIETGSIREMPKLKGELREKLLSHVRADPDRAEVLRREFNRGFAGIGPRIWPKWKFSRMTTTGALAHYSKMLQEIYMPGVAQLSLTHAASEGFLGLNVSFDAEDTTYMVMPLYGVMEFIPESHIEEEQPKTVFLEKLEEGACYEMVLTTLMGLYRYRMGDVIKITGFRNQCPLYEFQYRTGQLLNLYWEKTTESTFYSSLMNAAGQLGVSLVDYTATESPYLRDCYPDADAQSSEDALKHYIVFVDIKKDGVPFLLSEKEKLVFDRCLCEQSTLYSTLREKNSISAMRVVQVENKTFADVRHMLLADAQNVQVKLPRAMQNKDILKYLMTHQMTSSSV